MYIETLDNEKIAKARDRWSSLNETDLRSVGNDSEKLVDVVSRKGGLDREQARREVEAFLESCGCGSKPGQSRCSAPGSTTPIRDSGTLVTSEPRTGDRPGTSTDDQTGEMAAAGPGRKTRPDEDHR